MFELAEGTTAAAQASIWSTILGLLPMFLIFYFMLIRPQQKRAKERNALLSSLKEGDRVITIGGLHGQIIEIKDDKVILRVNDNMKLTYEKSAINAVLKNS